MHKEAYLFFSKHRNPRAESILECGGLDVNGSLVGLIPKGAAYLCVDLKPGKGVNMVADFSTYKHPWPVDEVWCANVLEHVEKWRDLIASAAANLKPEGRYLLTCAGPGWGRHGAWGALSPGPQEHYENVDPGELRAEIADHFARFEIHKCGYDLHVIASHPKVNGEAMS